MSTEQQLVELFDEQADEAPGTEDLLDGTLRRVRERRRHITGAGLTLAGVLAAVAVLATGLPARESPPGTVSAPTGSVPAGLAGSALPERHAEQSCVFGYSPAVIATRLDFALDGTVVAIGAPVSHRPGDPEPWDYDGVTLQVNEWFKGGSGRTITVDMPSGSHQQAEDDGAPTGYDIGTRMLVSGMARQGGGDPLAYPVAWWGCGGFTRYYSERVAAQWRAAMG